MLQSTPPAHDAFSEVLKFSKTQLMPLTVKTRELGDTAYETYVSSKDVTMFSQYLLYGLSLEPTCGDPVGRV